MEYGSATLEDIAEYDMVISQIFGSEEEGYNYYNAYARTKGFGVRKEELTRKSDTNIAFRRLYVCSKEEGYQARKDFEKTKRVRTPRPLSRCGWGARMEIELRMDNGEVAEVTKNDAFVLYTVARKESRHVTYDARSVMAGPLLQSVNCHCLKMDSEEIPCAHICSLYIFKASNSPETSQKVVDFLKGIIAEGGEDDGKNEAASLGPLPAYFSGSNQACPGNVRNPKIIKSKGAPSKTSNKRSKPINEIWKEKNVAQK